MNCQESPEQRETTENYDEWFRYRTHTFRTLALVESGIFEGFGEFRVQPLALLGHRLPDDPQGHRRRVAFPGQHADQSTDSDLRVQGDGRAQAGGDGPTPGLGRLVLLQARQGLLGDLALDAALAQLVS